MIRKSMLFLLMLTFWITVPLVYGQSCAAAGDIIPVQANLPQAGQAVQLLPLGAVMLDDLTQQSATTFIEVSPNTVTNVRSAPIISAAIVTTLERGQTVLADGRVADTSWLHVRLPEAGDGWMLAELLTAEDDMESLAFISAVPVVSAMQIFQLSSSDASSDCAGDGLLIQSPLDTIPADLNANGVDLSLQGTILIQLTDVLTVQVLEGSATVAAGDGGQSLIAGAGMTIPLDEDGLAMGASGEVRAYEADSLADLELPLDLLAREIAIAPPLTAAELASLLTCTIHLPVSVALREGPSTLHPQLGSLDAGETAEVIGQALGIEGMGWWQLADESWLRADIVDAGMNCDAVPQVETQLPPVPDLGMDLGTEFRIAVCDYPPPMAAGDLISFWIGGGGSRTLAEAQQTIPSYLGLSYLSVDDELLEIAFGLHAWGVGNYGVRVIGNWVATPGNHTVTGLLSGGGAETCSFVIAGAG